MANNATGTSWDETVPVIGSDRRDGHQEILGLRKGLRIRLEYEHDTLAASSVGGEHKKGSAKTYYQPAEPTQRPDAATNLGPADEGRLWIHDTTRVLKVYDDGTGQFELVSGTQQASGNETVAGLIAGAITVTVGFLPDIMFCKYGTLTYNSFIVMPASVIPVTIREYTTVNSNDWQFAVVGGDDISIERVAGTEAPTGTFHWRALKFT